MRTKSLDLGFNLFSIFPDITYMGFQFLEEFTLTGNRINVIPPTISLLSNLQTFNLNGNQIYELPPELGNVVSLTKLDISNNKLTSLFPEIGNLTNLQDLLVNGLFFLIFTLLVS